MPGQVNTVSTSTAPASIPENCRPAMVTTGRMAFRSACLNTTLFSERPLARAVRM